jgi:pyruvate formate lyase activating enzyme
MSSSNIGIVGWQKCTLLDFPGTIATILFFKGCNLRCPYCHNPDVVLKNLPLIDLQEVITFLNKRSGKIEGVVLSGGEPAIHTGLPEIVRVLKNLSMKVKLDTNGLTPGMITLCKPDYLALDIKALPKHYNALGYAKNDAEIKLKESLDVVRSMGNQAEVRITVVPQFINMETIEEIGTLVQGVKKVFLQNVNVAHPVIDSSFIKKCLPYNNEAMIKIKEIVGRYVNECTIRGGD